MNLSRSTYWLAANALGVAIYLFAASRIWPPLADRALPGGPGDPIIWALSAFPALAICALIDAAWLIMIILGIRRGLGWQPLVIWLAVIVVWVGANRYDAYRN